LTPKIRIWFIDSNRIDHKIGLGYREFDYIDGLFEKECFVVHMWNLLVWPIPHVEWQGGFKGSKENLDNFESRDSFPIVFDTKDIRKTFYILDMQISSD